MYIPRISSKIIEEFQKFPVVAILGPRQSGKTTFAKHHFKNYTFISFEEKITLSEAKDDPVGFLKKYENKHGIIIDEFQYVPSILSAIKFISDEIYRPGYFVITGSSNFLMNAQITQSLAGRVGILTMLPFSIEELQGSKRFIDDLDQLMIQGFYPRMHIESIKPDMFYPGYIHSYVERDIRQLSNVGDIHEFKRFMQLCAGRVGQLLNISDIATICGISRKTADQWLSLLQASYVLFLLQPYHENFNKRVIKQSKIYFFDTGLVCSLLGITDKNGLTSGNMYGHIFENFIIADLFKQYSHMGKPVPLFFWRDKNGHIEIDCLINQGYRLIPVEIKSSTTIRGEYFEGMVKFNQIREIESVKNYLIYAGDHTDQRKSGTAVDWKSFAKFRELIES